MQWLSEIDSAVLGSTIEALGMICTSLVTGIFALLVTKRVLKLKQVTRTAIEAMQEVETYQSLEQKYIEALKDSGVSYAPKNYCRKRLYEDHGLRISERFYPSKIANRIARYQALIGE